MQGASFPSSLSAAAVTLWNWVEELPLCETAPNNCHQVDTWEQRCARTGSTFGDFP